MRKILLLRTSFLENGWHTAGAVYLDEVAVRAHQDGYELEATDVVAYELSRSKIGLNVQEWLFDNKVRISSTRVFHEYWRHQQSMLMGVPIPGNREMKKTLLLNLDFVEGAWFIGGAAILDQLVMQADKDGFIVEMTDVVAYELSRSKIGLEVQEWLNTRSIRLVSTQEFHSYWKYQAAKMPGDPQYESRILGVADGKNSSIVEHMLAERTAGNVVMVASDDPFFTSLGDE